MAEPRVQAGEPRQGGAAAPLLRLFLLGRFEVVREDAPVPPHAWRRRRPADLLKLVALAPGRTLTREQTIDALWPSKDPASGANNLHRALYDLRQVLGGRWLDIDQGELSLRGDVWVDVDAFEASIRQGDRASLAVAAALYRGDLSPEDRDAPWIADRRALLRARFVEAALPLARAAEADGDARTAIPLLRRIVTAGPADEDLPEVVQRPVQVVRAARRVLVGPEGLEHAVAGEGPPGGERDELQEVRGPPAAPGVRGDGRVLADHLEPPEQVHAQRRPGLILRPRAIPGPMDLDLHRHHSLRAGG